MIQKKPDGSMPTLMTRAQVADYLNLTEKEVIELRHKPDFPKHMSTWRHWFYVGKEVQAWKLRNERTQLEIEDVIEARKVSLTQRERAQAEAMAAYALQVFEIGRAKLAHA